MSTPTAVADAELARMLSDNEDYILSVTKSQAVDLSKEMFQRCVISDSMMDQFSSLDHSRVDPKLQLRYLLRLVTQRIQEDRSVGDKFLCLLESMKEYPLCKYLRSKFGEIQPEVKRMSLDDSLTTEDISWLLEELAEVSPMWELLGIALRLPSYRIKNIKGNNNMINLCNLLEEWLSGASTAQPTTLRTLTQAMKSKIVGCSKLALEIEDKFRSLEVKIVSSNNIPDSSLLSLTITNQSSREVQVEDGKSTLLMVQASHRENVSYQWNKNGQPLADDYMYSGVHDNILVISQTHQGATGEYTCCVKTEERKVVSNKMNLKVLYSSEKKALLDLYSVNIHTRNDEWPPVGTETFINVVLVKSGVLTEDTSSFSADRVTEKTLKIEYRDVFRAYKKAALILIEGRPGSGKTTLVHKVIKDWAQGNALVRANLVFLVSLRFLCGDLQDNTLFSILKISYTNTEVDLENLVSDLEKNNGEGVCFVLDGLDEYHPHMGDKSVIFKLLNKSYLSLAMIIVFSRPGAITRLRQAVVTQHIEVRGFTKRQVSEYIDTFSFDSSPDSSVGTAKLKDYLVLHPNVFHMCYLPIHAAIICFVYLTSRAHLPHTQTKIYEEFTRSMILRHLKRINVEIQLYSLKELPEVTREYFSKLCLLAFNMTVEHKQVINERDISFPLCEDTSPRGDWSLGLVTCNRTAQLCGVSTSYMFLHLTLQEYLAAYHIANADGKEKGKLIERVKSRTQLYSDFTNLWTFFFGLEIFESSNELEIYHEILRTEPEIGIIYAFESQQEIVCNEIVRLNSGKIRISRRMLPSDAPAVTFVICNTSQPIRELELKYIRDSLTNKIFQQIKHVKFSHLRTLIVSFICNTEILRNLSIMLKFCTELRHVELHFSDLSPEGGKHLAATLQYVRNLVHLKLTGSHLPGTTVNAVTPGLMFVLRQVQWVCQLDTLDLSGLNMDGSHCEVLAFNIRQLLNLQHLYLTGNNISSEGAININSALCYLNKLKVLYLSINNIGFVGIVSLSSVLHHLTTLVRLNLAKNKIGSDGAVSLASTLHHLTELSHLNLSENGIDAHSAIQVITALKYCQKLQCVTFNKHYSDDFQLMANVQLSGLIASDDSATIDSLIAAIQLHKQNIDIHLGFKIIQVSI